MEPNQRGQAVTDMTFDEAIKDAGEAREANEILRNALYVKEVENQHLRSLIAQQSWEIQKCRAEPSYEPCSVLSPVH